MAKLEILNETVLYKAPRGEKELRVTHVQARTPDGKLTDWHSLRLFYKAQDGQWRPTTEGLTVRKAEAHEVAGALRTIPNDGEPAKDFAPTNKLDYGGEDVPF